MQASGSLVEVDILELMRILCPGVGICHTSIAPGLMLMKELDLKLTWESFPLMRSHGEMVSDSNLGQIQSDPVWKSGCFLSNHVYSAVKLVPYIVS